MCEWSHDPPGSDSWVSLIFSELREKPEEADTAATVRSNRHERFADAAATTTL
jgi:hypothetical protein